MPLKTIIHIDQHALRKNRKENRRDPVVTVKTSKRNLRGTSIRIGPNTTLIYSPDKPLKCGATIWLSTTEPVELDGTIINESHHDLTGSKRAAARGKTADLQDSRKRAAAIAA